MVLKFMRKKARKNGQFTHFFRIKRSFAMHNKREVIKMMLTAKETSLLKDLKSQEKLCVEKYGKSAQEACSGQLKDLFTQIGQKESQHLQTLEQIVSGSVPQTGGTNQQAAPALRPEAYQDADKQKDAYLCQDTLAMEKHVSATYNTSIFEFTDPAVRSALNHIQKEEQQHGEWIYGYMSQNGMYS